jgi:hypothetical protein
LAKGSSFAEQVGNGDQLISCVKSVGAKFQGLGQTVASAMDGFDFKSLSFELE